MEHSSSRSAGGQRSLPEAPRRPGSARRRNAATPSASGVQIRSTSDRCLSRGPHRTDLEVWKGHLCALRHLGPGVQFDSAAEHRPAANRTSWSCTAASGPMAKATQGVTCAWCLHTAAVAPVMKPACAWQCACRGYGERTRGWRHGVCARVPAGGVTFAAGCGVERGTKIAPATDDAARAALLIRPSVAVRPRD